MFYTQFPKCDMNKRTTTGIEHWLGNVWNLYISIESKCLKHNINQTSHVKNNQGTFSNLSSEYNENYI